VEPIDNGEALGRLERLCPPSFHTRNGNIGSLSECSMQDTSLASMKTNRETVTPVRTACCTEFRSCTAKTLFGLAPNTYHPCTTVVLVPTSYFTLPALYILQLSSSRVIVTCRSRLLSLVKPREFIFYLGG